MCNVLLSCVFAIGYQYKLGFQRTIDESNNEPISIPFTADSNNEILANPRKPSRRVAILETSRDKGVPNNIRVGPTHESGCPQQNGMQRKPPKSGLRESNNAILEINID